MAASIWSCLKTRSIPFLLFESFIMHVGDRDMVHGFSLHNNKLTHIVLQVNLIGGSALVDVCAHLF